MTDTDKLIKRMRGFEIDHEPDGWPAIRMRDISALCDLVERAIPALDLLQALIDKGCDIKKYNNEYWLFDGLDFVCKGDTVRSMLQNLIFTEC